MAMSEAKAIVDMVMALASLPAEPHLHDDLRDAQWADFGRTVSKNIYNPDFLEVLTRASLKSKSTPEMLGYIRAFILTGAKP